MKVLMVDGDDDYGASSFEEHMGVEDAMKKINEENITSFSIEEEDYSFNVVLKEFGEVDVKFIGFVRELQDYDDTKHRDFYIV